MRTIRRMWNAFTAAFTGWTGIALAALIGAILGVGIYTFSAAGIANYFGNDPRTCAACHAMTDQYEGWVRGSHHNVATCNDCHAPHNNLVSKYLNKGENGFMHSLKFTLGNYPENIQIREHNKAVTEAACIYCHGDFVEQVTHGASVNNETVSCIRCHDGVGHQR